MATWFSCKAKFTKEIDAGKFETVTEEFLIDAVSYTDAEARLYEQYGDNAPDFRVGGITPVKVQEVFHIEGPEIKWYKVKVTFSHFNEKTKKEKKDTTVFFVNADSAMQAIDRVQNALGRMDDAEVTGVELTNILEVVPYESPAEKDQRQTAVKAIANDFHKSMQDLADEGGVEISVKSPDGEEKTIAVPKKLKTGKDYSPPSKNQNYPKVDTVNY